MIKTVVSLFFMCCALTVFAQSNELTSEEFYNIQFNGVSFKTLEATKGSTIAMAKIIHNATVEEGEGGMGDGWRSYTSSNLTVAFNDVDTTNSSASIYHIKGTEITVNGITAAIGDNISVLGTVNVHTNADGTHSIMYTLGKGDCCPVIIEYDQASNLITNIAYYVWS